ncbi:MAG: Gfo/Idh/MocA family oxidoreductase [Armatimonadetes bacterium]|nr:Gfo/Idh/MocA family oxidoreductase [Armatimonadota bacterium]
MSKVKWGVIGAGGIADRRTIPEGIMPASNSELAAIMDVDEPRVKELAWKYNAPRWYASDAELLDDPAVEAVYIATPVNVHVRQAVAAAEKGKHVLCEKPLALTLDESRRIVDACKAAGVKLSVGLMMRYHACHQGIRKAIEDGEIGRPVMARAQLTCWYPQMPGAWRQIPELGGGGALMDLGVHSADLLRCFLGEVEAVTAFVDTTVQDYPVDDSALVLMKFKSGAQGVVESYFSIPDAAAQNALEIYGTKGCILAKGTIGQGSEGSFTVYSSAEDKGYEAAQTRDASGMAVRVVTPDPVNTYCAEIEAFADAILNDAVPPITAEDAIASFAAVLAAYKSSREGRAIKL